MCNISRLHYYICRRKWNIIYVHLLFPWYRNTSRIQRMTTQQNIIENVIGVRYDNRIICGNSERKSASSERCDETRFYPLSDNNSHKKKTSIVRIIARRSLQMLMLNKTCVWNTAAKWIHYYIKMRAPLSETRSVTTASARDRGIHIHLNIVANLCACALDTHRSYDGSCLVGPQNVRLVVYSVHVHRWQWTTNRVGERAHEADIKSAKLFYWAADVKATFTFDFSVCLSTSPRSVSAFHSERIGMETKQNKKNSSGRCSDNWRNEVNCSQRLFLLLLFWATQQQKANKQKWKLAQITRLKTSLFKNCAKCYRAEKAACHPIRVTLYRIE